jgi:hypothetical protein
VILEKSNIKGKDEKNYVVDESEKGPRSRTLAFQC